VKRDRSLQPVPASTVKCTPSRPSSIERCPELSRALVGFHPRWAADWPDSRWIAFLDRFDPSDRGSNRGGTTNDLGVPNILFDLLRYTLIALPRDLATTMCVEMAYSKARGHGPASSLD
jgi:hypothetical protein